MVVMAPESNVGVTVKSQLGAAQTAKLPLAGEWVKVTVLPLTAALIVHDGAVTVTLAESLPVPPGPVQLSVKVELAVKVPLG